MRCLIQSPAGSGDEGDRTKGEARTRERENSVKAKRLRAIGSRRKESTKQFEHETKRDLCADVRHGATRKQNTINNFSCRTSGDQEPK